MFENSERKLCEDDLWQPFTLLELQLDGETLDKIDAHADQVEIDRLLQTGVITTHEKFSGDFGSQLSAKVVCAWKEKSRNNSLGWLRRSRLVAREYKWLDVRDDVYSPSSNSAVVKPLPALHFQISQCQGW